MSKYGKVFREINIIDNSIKSLLLEVKQNPLKALSNGSMKKVAELKIKKNSLQKWIESESKKDEAFRAGMLLKHESITLKGWI